MGGTYPPSFNSLVEALHDPQMSSMATLHYVLLQAKRSQVPAGADTPRTRLPITKDIMRLLKRSWEAWGIHFTTVMLWAVACTCFFGFLRSGEATLPAASAYDPGAHLSISDVSVNSPTSPTKICVRIKASKTDPFRQGVTICLGKTGQEMCPVMALLSYHCTEGSVTSPAFSLRRWAATHERSCHVRDKNNCRKCEPGANGN